MQLIFFQKLFWTWSQSSSFTFLEGICDSLRNVPHRFLIEHLPLIDGTVWGPYRNFRTWHLAGGSVSTGVGFPVWSLCVMYVDKNVINISQFSAQAALCLAFLTSMDAPGIASKINTVYNLYLVMMFYHSNKEKLVRHPRYALSTVSSYTRRFPGDKCHASQRVLAPVLAMSLWRCKGKLLAINWWCGLYSKYLLCLNTCTVLLFEKNCGTFERQNLAEWK